MVKRKCKFCVILKTMKLDAMSSTRKRFAEIILLSPFALISLLQMKGGCCIAASNTAIVIGMFNELKQHTSAGCNTNVTELAKYLKSVNA